MSGKQTVQPEAAVPVPETEGTGKPDLAELSSGAVFTRAGTLLSEGFTGSDNVPVSGWLLHPVLNADEFDGALKRLGWKWFYIGPVFTASCYGRLSGELMDRLVGKTATEAHGLGENSFTLTAVEVRRMPGFSTVYLSAQPRHLQPGFPHESDRGE